MAGIYSATYSGVSLLRLLVAPRLLMTCPSADPRI